MGFIKAINAKQPTFIKCLFYGKAGTGKTTLALSAPNPAVIDFDGGLHRVNFMHRYGVDVLQPEKWEDVMTTLGETASMSGYETIVVDTIDKMMDFIITYKCGTRQPTLKDWGGINAEFTRFCRAIDALQKNVIFLAHEVSTTDKDVTCYRPALRDKNFTAVQNELDILGFLQRTEIQGVAQRTLTFFAANCEGKKPSNFPDSVVVPACLDENGTMTRQNDFFKTTIFAPYLAMKQKEIDALQQYNALMIQIGKDIDAVKDVDTANAFIANAGNYQHVGNSLQMMRQIFVARVGSLGLVFDKNTKSYVAA